MVLEEVNQNDSPVVVENGVIQIDGAHSNSNSSHESQGIYDTESIQSPMNNWGPDQRSDDDGSADEDYVLVQPVNYQTPDVTRFCIEGAPNCLCLTYGWYVHQRIWNWRKLNRKN